MRPTHVDPALWLAAQPSVSYEDRMGHREVANTRGDHTDTCEDFPSPSLHNTLQAWEYDGDASNRRPDGAADHGHCRVSRSRLRLRSTSHHHQRTRFRTSAPADSTAKNRRDKDHATLTPIDQAQGSRHDVDLTRQIRRALMADPTLSTNAKNIKIVTLNGRTTLRGPVKTAGEQKRCSEKGPQDCRGTECGEPARSDRSLNSMPIYKGSPA